MYNRSEKLGEPELVYFYPGAYYGYDGFLYKPYGWCALDSDTDWSAKGWAERGFWRYDYGGMRMLYCEHFDPNTPETYDYLGFYGFGVATSNDTSGYYAQMNGYPNPRERACDQPGDQRNYCGGLGAFHDVSENFVHYKIKTAPGDSGSGLFIQPSSNAIPKVVAIHTGVYARSPSVDWAQGVKMNFSVYVNYRRMADS